VHSDFKPANAFICENGEVKVLDFGIARAVKQPGQAATTMFDPGSLGVLTPAYASPDMLEGESPDPRDDIYALGVVSYILLSGVHPFDRKSANLAKGLHLKPKPISSLSRAQNHALASALQLERDERTPDVETFLGALDESALEKKLKFQSRLLGVLGIGCVVLLGCVVYLMLR
jgi:serine/threonine protein kinase